MKCKHCHDELTQEPFLGKMFYIDSTGGDECLAEEDVNGNLRERKYGLLAHEPKE